MFMNRRFSTADENGGLTAEALSIEPTSGGRVGIWAVSAASMSLPSPISTARDNRKATLGGGGLL